MIQKIKSYALTLMALLMFGMPTLVPLAVSADSVCNNGGIADQVSSGANQAALGAGQGGNCTDSAGVSQSSLAKIGHTVVNWFSLIIGIIAVIMLIYGGFRYITSGGSSEKVGNAKNTLIYAIIGLVIVALAQIIVHFVLSQTNSAISS
ncbi:MAG TPA: pilin [Candidatus Saccharimonadales bacterium]|jgi:hypothetical protein|nr:pilin [Candidatus Saccharimonadales bacterium]